MNEMQGRHNAILENRSRLMLTGVTDVECFNEEVISLYTQLGELKNLHINEMSVDSGDLSVEGDISSLVYGEKDLKKRLSLIGKLFR